MSRGNKCLNLILSGGGVKGIAYIGALKALDLEGWNFSNIAGVSAGAMVGSILASGYSPHSLMDVLNKFNFAKIKGNDIVRRIPIILEYIDFLQNQRVLNEENKEFFLLMERLKKGCESEFDELNFHDMRCGVVKKIIKFCNKGYLFDGDYLEEWMYKVLIQKGIRTFGDLRGGISDRVNPRGYKMRMTSVDATRGKIVVLPDDMEFYGIHPDDFEVAKAVRMSTSVPFVFKPVEIKGTGDDGEKNYYFVDGGVFDNFPFWLIDNENKPTIGIKIEGKSFLKGLNPVKILKNIISNLYNIGTPKKVSFDSKNIISIDVSNISFLDFDLDENEKNYLIESGYKSVKNFFKKDKRGGFNSWYYDGMLILALLIIKRFIQ